jgi:hypothetical protein
MLGDLSIVALKYPDPRILKIPCLSDQMLWIIDELKYGFHFLLTDCEHYY